MERIRYRKIKANDTGVVTLKESMQVFTHPTNGAQYKVVINLPESQWLVVDATTELVAASGHNTDPLKLQKEARLALSSLGVVLLTEKRRERIRKYVPAQ